MINMINKISNIMTRIILLLAAPFIFFMAQTVSKALLCIYDLQGTQLKQTLITQRGDGIETVFASEFPAGIYLYALLADGNQVDVKRMILTE